MCSGSPQRNRSCSGGAAILPFGGQSDGVLSIDRSIMERIMITGMHAVIYTRDAEADRAFFRDVLGLSSVDAGDGWLIFAAPPSEVACHPAANNDKHELYLMCDDVQ